MVYKNHYKKRFRLRFSVRGVLIQTSPRGFPRGLFVSLGGLSSKLGGSGVVDMYFGKNHNLLQHFPPVGDRKAYSANEVVI